MISNTIYISYIYYLILEIISLGLYNFKIHIIYIISFLISYKIGLASGLLRGAGSLNYLERLMLGAYCLALRCHVCDDGALFREVEVKAW